MKKILPAILFALVASTFTELASANCMTNGAGKMICPPPEGTCIQNRYRDVVCSPTGGGIVLDRYQEPVCGPGACVTNARGEVHCSRTPRGSAAIDISATAVCTDGCVPASASLCVKPSPAN